MGTRNVLEGRLIWLALSALRIGVNVVLDFGVWAKVERSALRALAASVGATSELVYLQVDEEEQWRRVQARALTDSRATFEMTKRTSNGGGQSSAAGRDRAWDSGPRPSPDGFDSWEAGWLSGGQRPSPATDPHNRCSTDLQSMLGTVVSPIDGLLADSVGFGPGSRLCGRDLRASALLLALSPFRRVRVLDQRATAAGSEAGTVQPLRAGLRYYTRRFKLVLSSIAQDTLRRGPARTTTFLRLPGV